MLGASEEQASATLVGLVDACALREKQISQTLEAPQAPHGGPERPGSEPQPELTNEEITELRDALSEDKDA